MSKASRRFPWLPHPPRSPSSKSASKSSQALFKRGALRSPALFFESRQLSRHFVGILTRFGVLYHRAAAIEYHISRGLSNGREFPLLRFNRGRPSDSQQP